MITNHVATVAFVFVLGFFSMALAQHGNRCRALIAVAHCQQSGNIKAKNIVIVTVVISNLR